MKKLRIFVSIFALGVLLSGCNTRYYLTSVGSRLPGFQILASAQKKQEDNNVKIAEEPQVIIMDLGFNVDKTYSLDEINSMLNYATAEYTVILGNKNENGEVTSESFNGKIFDNPFKDFSNYFIFRGQQDNNIFVFQTDIEAEKEAQLKRESEEAARKFAEEQAKIPDTYNIKTIKKLLYEKLGRKDAVILNYIVLDENDEMIATKSIIRASNIDELDMIPVSDFIYTGKQLSKLGNNNYYFNADGQDFNDPEMQARKRRKEIKALIPEPIDGYNACEEGVFFYEKDKDEFKVSQWVLTKDKGDDFYYWAYFDKDGKILLDTVLEEGEEKFIFDKSGKWCDEDGDVKKFIEDGETPFVNLEEIEKQKEKEEKAKAAKMAKKATKSETIATKSEIDETETKQKDETKKEIKKNETEDGTNETEKETEDDTETETKLTQEDILVIIPSPEEGLNKVGDDYYFCNAGKFSIGSWAFIKAPEGYYYWSYFDNEGKMVRNKVVSNYYINKDGRRVVGDDGSDKLMMDGVTTWNGVVENTETNQQDTQSNGPASVIIAPTAAPSEEQPQQTQQEPAPTVAPVETTAQQATEEYQPIVSAEMDALVKSIQDKENMR